MKRATVTEEQIIDALRLAETGHAVAAVCRRFGIDKATFRAWQEKYSGLGIHELRQLRRLEEENLRLKQLVAELTLKKQTLSERAKKKKS